MQNQLLYCMLDCSYKEISFHCLAIGRCHGVAVNIDSLHLERCQQSAELRWADADNAAARSLFWGL